MERDKTVIEDWNYACSQLKFIGSFDYIRQLPQQEELEFALIGRSNVGKSSLINALCQQKIARTSKTPGKTRQFVYFDLGKLGYMVDLPGYGYAKVSAKQQEVWHEQMQNYLMKRRQLKLLLLLIDSRLGVKESDQKMLEWIGFSQTPALVVFTKWDKIRSSQRNKQKSFLRAQLSHMNIDSQVVSDKNLQLQHALIEKLMLHLNS